MPTLRIDVAKSAYHHVSQSEIAGDNPCSRQLSERTSFPINALIVQVKDLRRQIAIWKPGGVLLPSEEGYCRCQAPNLRLRRVIMERKRVTTSAGDIMAGLAAGARAICARRP
jgi:hypothetical protein